MKNHIQREQVKIKLFYGSLCFIVGTVGLFFQSYLKFLMIFCFIFGGTSVLNSMVYFLFHRKTTSSKNEERTDP